MPLGCNPEVRGRSKVGVGAPLCARSLELNSTIEAPEPLPSLTIHRFPEESKARPIGLSIVLVVVVELITTAGSALSLSSAFVNSNISFDPLSATQIFPFASAVTPVGFINF